MARRRVVAIQGRNVAAVIAFHESDIYVSDAASAQRPKRVTAPDPRGRFHKVRHHAGNPSGIYEDDSAGYWEELTHELAPAGAILVLGHGTGRANASQHWVSYVNKHHPEVAAKVVADVHVDTGHLDQRQVLRLAQIYFCGEPPLSAA